MKDNRPPKEERTLKRGDIREDGMVFFGYKAGSKNGEHWVTRDRLEEFNRSRRTDPKPPKYENEESRKEAARIRKNNARRERYSRDLEYRKKILSSQAEWLRLNQKPKKPRKLQTKEEKREYQRKYQQEKRDTDPKWKIMKNLRTRISTAIRGSRKSASTVSLLGCSVDELNKHLESQFTTGMTWDNYGYYGWHVDHIKPCASFDLTLDSEQKKCFHYTNLQPLWAKDNMNKSDKYENE
mgnify:CR=1 FL=1